MRDEMMFVERLHNELRDVRWPEPAVLRERARRRRRRAMLSAATAVVLLAAGPAIAGVRLAAPQSAPPQSADSQPQTSLPVYAEIPHEALVQPEDLTTKTDPPLSHAGFGEPVRVDELLLACLTEQGQTDAWEVSRYSRSQTLLRASADGARRPADVVLNQAVYRLAPETAAGFLQRLDVLIAPCASWRVTGEVSWEDRIARAEVEHRWEVTDRAFTGDEAMLIRHVVVTARNLDTGESRGPTSPDTTAVVRVGDLVTVLAPGRDTTDAELRRVATLAATRLCPAANPPC
ncbi:hypothetical protein [Micromonospora sp. NBC_01739]|uniref:hypothetical protein n=1 Tax=Micromonospora sp. NBC_01739 TaxID=2975985 RepID=UPI002E0D324D|nr:hypothetical protein OIE53_18205 [Micromonospora sp. NBC_01739]